MIYILEDDDGIRELVIYSLGKSGKETLGFDRPSYLFSSLSDRVPDLILLDLMLPEEDGFSVLAKLKANAAWRRIPVIVLSAKDSEFDKVTALNRGADDYLTKPFGVLELDARVEAVLRRSRLCPESDFAVGNMTVSVSKRRVSVSEEEINLTHKEFELLILLLENEGIVLTRNQILTRVWGYDFDGENRTVDVHIRSLRRKLGTAGDGIETVRSVGYRFIVENN